MPNSWITAVKKARKELKITGFQPVTKGTKLYKRAKAIQNKMKPAKTKKGGLTTAGKIKKGGLTTAGKIKKTKKAGLTTRG